MQSSPARRYHTFHAKVAAAAAMIGMADLFFYDHWPATTIGVFGLVWTVILAIVRPDVRRHRSSGVALFVAAGFGLVLIDDPSIVVAGRSARWLINASAAAAGVMLTAASLVDLGAVAAAWNVRHARTAADLDLCYLHNLGPSALLPLIQLERRAAGPRLRDQAVFVRLQIMADLTQRQADWRSWTGRDARRLSAAYRLLGPMPLQPQTVPNGRDCDGEPYAPPPPATSPRPRPTPTLIATSSSLTKAARP